MDMKNTEIIDALNCLEMSGGMHQVSEQLRQQIVDALTAPKVSVKRSPPKVKGKPPE